jgi:phi13 family phage major tail protein
MAKVGLSNLHYAKLVQDIITGVVYETTVKVTGLITANITAASSSATLYADNGPAETASTLGEVRLSIEVSELPVVVAADWLGHTVDGGIMKSNVGDSAPYIAVMFEGLKSNNSKRFVKLLKGKAQEPEDNYKTKGESIEFQSQTIELVFVKRDFDGDWKHTADEDHEDYVPSIGTNWYTSVESAGDTTAPTVTCNIADAATGIAVSSDIVFTFNEAIRISDVTNKNILVMKADGTVVAGAITYDTAHEVVTFNPTANLSATTAHIAIVTTNVKDLAGNALAAPFVVNFTTG